MYTQVNFNDFRDAFERIRPDNFSYEGLQCLFDYLEEMEEDTGTEIELDVIAICCDYNEDTIENILKEYNLETIEELEKETLVLPVDDDTIIIQNF